MKFGYCKALKQPYLHIYAKDKLPDSKKILPIG
jgi:hypothetical protein